MNAPSAPRPVRFAILALALAGAGCRHARLTAPVPEWVTRSVEKTIPLAPGGVAALENLAGSIRVTAAPGGTTVKVVARIHAGGRTATEAAALAALLAIKVGGDPGHAWIASDYPLSRADRYYYPEWEALGDGGGFGFLDFSLGGGHRRMCKGSLGGGLGCTITGRYRDGEATIASRPLAGALPLYADLDLIVPDGAKLKIENRVGAISIEGMRGGAAVEAVEGPLRLARCGGDVTIDHGRGSVLIERHEGGALAITSASGPVAVYDSRGRMKIDGGGADIRLSGVEGESLELETGSGDLILSRVSGRLKADTGSGSILAEGLAPRGELSLESGSGDIIVDGDLRGASLVSLESGSGSIRFGLADPPGLDLELSTGSGSMTVALDSLGNIENDRHDYTARYGAGGLPVKLETGSGDILLKKGSVAPAIPPPPAPPDGPRPPAAPVSPAPAVPPAPAPPRSAAS